MSITRRELFQLGFSAAAIACCPSMSWSSDRCPKSVPIALQLYSIRSDCQKDLPKMIEAVAKMGYTGVELMAGNFGADAREFRKILDDNGLKCCGTHTGADTLNGDNLARIADYMTIIGGPNLIVPWLDGNSKEDWLRHAGWLSGRAEAAKKLGCCVGFHNHAHEMSKKFDGKCAWEYIFDNTPQEVIHQVDIGHCVHADADPVPFIKKYAGRSKTVHIAEDGGGGIIGRGRVDWKSVLPALANEGGTEWFVIECENIETPVKDAEDCINGLKALL